MNRKYLKLAILPLLAIVFLSALPLLNSQTTAIITVSDGAKWSFKVDSAKTDSLVSVISAPKIDTKLSEKPLQQLNSTLKDLKTAQALTTVEYYVSFNGLSLYKQKPLNEELDVKQYTFVNSTHAMNGTTTLVYRPLDVINSYACYDSDNKKVMHIYASKLIASDGKICYVDMNINNGVLSVTLNQTWLSTAKYPVVVDPTFGYSSTGASWANIDGDTVACRAQLTEAGTLTKISAYTKVESTAVNANIALYDEATALPNALLSSSVAAYSESSTTGAWHDVTFTDELTAGYYWFAISGNAGLYIAYDSAGSSSRDWGATFDNPWVSGANGTEKYSIYATYTTGEATPTPTATPTEAPTETPTPTPTEPPTTESIYSPTFIVLLLILILDIALIIINRQSTMLYLLMLIMGIMTFAFGVFALTVPNLPFWPYFNIFVIVIGVITMTVSIRGRN